MREESWLRIKDSRDGAESVIDIYSRDVRGHMPDDAFHKALTIGDSDQLAWAELIGKFDRNSVCEQRLFTVPTGSGA
jgi:hypothetical protein